MDKAPKTIVPGKSQDELLKDCLSDFVIQRILVMDNAPAVVSSDVPAVSLD